MHRVKASYTSDELLKLWSLPDRAFFAAAASNILTYVLTSRYSGFEAVWLRPGGGFDPKCYPAQHFVAISKDHEWVFDYRGLTSYRAHQEHLWHWARRRWPGWHASYEWIGSNFLVSQDWADRIPGLWIVEPNIFPCNAFKRANAFLHRIAHTNT